MAKFRNVSIIQTNLKKINLNFLCALFGWLSCQFLFLNCTEQNQSPPIVKTNEVSAFTVTTANVSGTVISDNNSKILEKGVCWSKNPGPTILDSYSTSSDIESDFTVELNRLCAFTTYYLRAYAVNTNGIGYGNEVSLTTMNIWQVISVTTDKLSYGLCEPISITIKNNSPIDTLLYSLCDGKLEGNEQILEEGGNWETTTPHLCFLGSNTGARLLLPFESVSSLSARIAQDECAKEPGTHRMIYQINTTLGIACFINGNQETMITSNPYQIVK